MKLLFSLNDENMISKRQKPLNEYKNRSNENKNDVYSISVKQKVS